MSSCPHLQLPMRPLQCLNRTNQFCSWAMVSKHDPRHTQVCSIRSAHHCRRYRQRLVANDVQDHDRLCFGLRYVSHDQVCGVARYL